MRIERGPDGEVVRVVLSRRNLRSLLLKLEDPLSLCTLLADGVFVAAEHDQDHYATREPGQVHPRTDIGLRQWKEE
jgi:hypothetical protein